MVGFGVMSRGLRGRVGKGVEMEGERVDYLMDGVE